MLYERVPVKNLYLSHKNLNSNYVSNLFGSLHCDMIKKNTLAYPYMQISSIGLKMGLEIFLSSRLGKLLDKRIYTASH